MNHPPAAEAIALFSPVIPPGSRQQAGADPGVDIWSYSPSKGPNVTIIWFWQIFKDAMFFMILPGV